MRIYIGNARACTFEDEMPDTVDGGTLYNSFTFSPTDALLIETLDGFQCSVLEAEEGEVSLRIDLPPSASSERQIIRMLYEVNDGDRSFERWVDVVSRSFSVESRRRERTVVMVRQDASRSNIRAFSKKP